MQGDRETRGTGEKKSEESKCSVAADQETVRKMKRGEEDSGGSAMRARGSKRKREEDGLSPGSRAGDLETETRRRKEKEDGKSDPESKGTNKEEEHGESFESRTGMMGRMRKRQRTDTAIEDARSSMAKETLSGDRGKTSRQTPESPDPDSGSSSQGSKVTIHQLPDLSLIEIFRKLDAENKACVARVCKKWRALVYSPSLWKHSIAHLEMDTLSLADLVSLRRRRIRRVDVMDCIGKRSMRRLISALPSLEAFDASCIQLTDRGLAEVFPRTRPHLRRLALKLYLIDAPSFSHLAGRLQNLSCLHVSSSSCSQDLWSELRTLSSLEEFSFLCSSDEQLQLPNPQPEAMPRLKNLKLCSDGVGDDILHYVVQAFPNLQKFSAILAENTTDNGVEQLTQLKKLQELELVKQGSIPLSQNLLETLENVRILKLTWVNVRDEQLQALAQLPELEWLEISCLHISEEGWRALGQGFKRLKSLRLQDFDCSEEVTVEHFRTPPSLEEIHFDYLKVSKSQVKLLFCALNRVQKLSIWEAPTVTDDHMKEIAKMKNLRELELGCTQVGDEGLEHLAGSKVPLESLCFRDNKASGPGYLCIAQQKKSLKSLKLCECVQVEVLLDIVKDLPHLRELTTPLCSEVKQMLKHLNPSLTVHAKDACVGGNVF